MQISIHAARVGCDSKAQTSQAWTRYFNPRSPSGLRPELFRSIEGCCGNFNPRSPSGLRLACQRNKGGSLEFQSTQPEWAATGYGASNNPAAVISIHAARVGCDCKCLCSCRWRKKFQSTQPEWAATIS